MGNTICLSSIELWDDADRHIEEVIALTSGTSLPRMRAYDEAVKRRPGKLITLRQKARVIRRVWFAVWFLILAFE